MDIVREYKRDMYCNYMVLQALEDDRYEARMLMENDIAGIMKVQLRNVDDMEYYYYDISSKQPLANLFERGQLKYDQIKSIMTGIISAIEEGSRYLLSENDFILNTEYIFITLSSFNVSLCCYPGYNTEISGQLTGVIEYLMDRTDHTDEKAVMFVYGLYKATKQEFTINSIKKIVEGMSFEKEFHSDISEGVGGDIARGIEGDIPRDIAEGFEDGFEFSKVDKENDKVIEHRKETKEKVRCFDYLDEEVMEKNKREKKNSGVKLEDYKYTIGGVVVFVIVMTLAYLNGIILDMRGKIDVIKLASVSLVAGGALTFAVIKIKESTCSEEVDDYIERTAGDNEEKDVSKDFLVNDEESQSYVVNNMSEINPYTGEYENETVLLTDYTKEEEEYVLLAKYSDKYKNVTISQFPFIIGKLRDKVDCVLTDDAISRLHAKIYMIDNNQLVITDLNSKNGTFVNGERLLSNETRMINKGDEIGFADLIFNLQ